MSKKTVRRVQGVMRTLAVLGWLAFIGVLLAYMGGFCPREISALVAGGGLVFFTLGIVFGGCMGWRDM